MLAGPESRAVVLTALEALGGGGLGWWQTGAQLGTTALGCAQLSEEQEEDVPREEAICDMGALRYKRLQRKGRTLKTGCCGVREGTWPALLPSGWG